MCENWTPSSITPHNCKEKGPVASHSTGQKGVPSNIWPCVQGTETSPRLILNPPERQTSSTFSQLSTDLCWEVPRVTVQLANFLSSRFALTAEKATCFHNLKPVMLRELCFSWIVFMCLSVTQHEFIYT